jgi:hypothetical protein
MHNKGVIPQIKSSKNPLKTQNKKSYKIKIDVIISRNKG